MRNFSKVIVLTLTGISLYTASISKLSQSALAGEPVIDRNCNFHNRTPEVVQKIPPENQATIAMTSPFEVKNQKYALQILKFPDSTNVLCLQKPNTQLPQRLNNVAMIQDKEIEKIEKDTSWTGKYAPNYLVTVKGDKSENILRTVYKLNLTNPNQPQLVLIVTLYKK